MTLIHLTHTLNIKNFLLRIPVPWVFVLTYLVGLAPDMLFPFRFHPGESAFWIKIGGIVLFATGLFLASWCLLIFHKARTTTTPGENSKTLVIRGPYQLSRNPMYISLVLAYLGEAGFLLQAWPVLVLPLAILYADRVVIPLEEDTLRKDFKEVYENYCTQVRRWL